MATEEHTNCPLPDDYVGEDYYEDDWGSDLEDDDFDDPDDEEDDIFDDFFDCEDNEREEEEEDLCRGGIFPDDPTLEMRKDYSYCEDWESIDDKIDQEEREKNV